MVSKRYIGDVNSLTMFTDKSFLHYAADYRKHYKCGYTLLLVYY